MLSSLLPAASEQWMSFFEVITLKKLGQLNKPVIVFNVDGFYDKLIEVNEAYG